MRTLYSILFLGAALSAGPSQIDAQSTTVKPAAAPQVSAPAVPAAADPETIPLDQQASKEELAKLFEVMRIRAQFENSMKAIPGMIQQQVQAQASELAEKLPGGRKLTDQEQEEIDNLTHKYMDKALNIYPVEEMISDMTGVYQRHLGRTDVEAFIAFYSSQPGQDLLNAQPVILKEYMPMVMGQTQQRTKDLIDEMTRDMTDSIKAPATPAKPEPAPAAAAQPK